MIRGLILLFSMFIFMLQAQSFELVLPKEKNCIVNTNYAFFVGRAKNGESISINGENVYTASNGAFAHSVPLKDGENRIMLRSPYGIQMFKFYKNDKQKNVEFPLEEFEPIMGYVKRDNTPMRSEPVDAGLNRISHLFECTPLIINGSKGNFYRVFLSSNKTAWILKEHVQIDLDYIQTPTDFITMDSERYKNAFVQTISFTKKLPYTIEDTEEEIIFKVYNPEMDENSVYTLNIPKPEKYTYNVKMDGGKYTVKVRKLPEKKEDYTIIIDAGHGGSEKGAVGCLGDEEKNINLKLAQELYNILKKQGLNVHMTRECDANVSLNDRVDFAKDNGADVFVSIHFNSIPDICMDIHKNRGTSVYYYNDNSKEFAEILEKNVTKIAGTRSDGVRTASFAVIRPSDYVGVLVETAYMTNPLDSLLYRSDKFMHKAANAISKGILEYIKKD